MSAETTIVAGACVTAGSLAAWAAIYFYAVRRERQESSETLVWTNGAFREPEPTPCVTVHLLERHHPQGDIMAKPRIYCVTASDGTEALVKAHNPSQAIRHITRSEFTARVASQEDLVNHLAGVSQPLIEDATTEAADAAEDAAAEQWEAA